MGAWRGPRPQRTDGSHSRHEENHEPCALSPLPHHRETDGSRAASQSPRGGPALHHRDSRSRLGTSASSRTESDARNAPVPVRWRCPAPVCRRACRGPCGTGAREPAATRATPPPPPPRRRKDISCRSPPAEHFCFYFYLSGACCVPTATSHYACSAVPSAPSSKRSSLRGCTNGFHSYLLFLSNKQCWFTETVTSHPIPAIL
ncbi:hypothetical protein VPH35_038645 [Triticum aestivum]